MAYDEDTLNKIYDRTNGRCHICGKKLSFINYFQFGRKGAWEVEHSHPRVKGGSDHRNNLYAACISCNRGKGTVTTQTARAWYGRTKAPLSKVKRKEVRQSHAIAGALLGAFVGLFAGPGGALVGAAIGGKIGYDSNPDK
ncbi:MAG: HNH endonuclease [Ignavibacteriae bacterium]|nr:HNH endonuclease [Ignavibacteria bacterium]MBI3365980.1 HNH endonuclease [Ignavibacteriota bacterium]